MGKIISQAYIISGILGDDRDISPNMKRALEETDILFVEEIEIFYRLIQENNILFSGELIEMNSSFKLEGCKKLILTAIADSKTIGLFESSGTACLVDPGHDIVNFLYSVQTKIPVDIVPIPGTGAISTAISVCGFNMDKHVFLNGIHSGFFEDLSTYSLPCIYFNHYRVFDELLRILLPLKKSCSYDRCFVGINLGKMGVEYPNYIIRGVYSNVYHQLEKLSGEIKIVPDMIFIFE